MIIGKPPTLVERDIFCEECKSIHDIEVCPDCGAYITIGFGLLGGGFGLYKFCNNECGWFWKQVEEDKDE